MKIRRICVGTCGIVVLLAVCLGATFSQAGLAQDDPLIGTWKLNVAKSKYSPGPPPKSAVLKFEARGDGVRVTSDGINAEGKLTHTEYTANYDGKDYPIGGSAEFDSVVLKRIDSHTTERISKKGGKVVRTQRRVVSKDGEVLTITVTGTNAKGQAVNNVVVYEKQ